MYQYIKKKKTSITYNRKTVMTMTIGYVALVGIGKDLTYGDNMRNSRVQRNMIFRQKWHAYRAHVLDFCW